MNGTEAILGVERWIAEHRLWASAVSSGLERKQVPSTPDVFSRGEAVLNEWIADLAASDVVVRHEYMSVAGAFSDLKNLIGQIAAEGQGFTRSHWPSLLCPRSILSARIRSATLALLLLRQALILRHRNSLA
jgi:hypothetical protein